MLIYTEKNAPEGHFKVWRIQYTRKFSKKSIQKRKIFEKFYKKNVLNDKMQQSGEIFLELRLIPVKIHNFTQSKP